MRIFSTNIIQPYSLSTKKAEPAPGLNTKFIGQNAELVTFCGKKHAKNSTASQSAPLRVNFSTLKEIKGLTCIYCGAQMLTPSLKYELTEKIAAATGEKLISELTKSKKYLSGWKKNIATEIMNLANTYPDENIQELMRRLVDNCKLELESEQLNICNNIRQKYENSFSTKTEKTLFDSILQETEQWITGKNQYGDFKRKIFLYELGQILYLPIFRNKQITKQILKDAEQMPHSFESESAFVVKYYKRSPGEIAAQLFYERTPTIEHIKPKTAGGSNDTENLAIACAKCNNTLRSNMPIPIFVSKHPEIIGNIRKNLARILSYEEVSPTTQKTQRKKTRYNPDDVTHSLEELKRTSKYRRYVSAIARTFQKESKGKISLEDFIND